MRLHLLDGKGDLGIVHVGIFPLDQGVGGAGGAVQIMDPAEDRGLDESPSTSSGFFSSRCAAGLDGGGVGFVAVIGEQEDIGLKPPERAMAKGSEVR